ncbi:hypothetical protein AMTRI_Chr01g113170 [Amborella trichopoda]
MPYTDRSEMPRISFSSDDVCRNREAGPVKGDPDFEFIVFNSDTLVTADELFFQGKLLPLRRPSCSSQALMHRVSFNCEERETKAGGPCGVEEEIEKKATVVICGEEDPSPRPPTCSGRWKELLKLRLWRAQAPSSKSERKVSNERVDGVTRVEEEKESAVKAEEERESGLRKVGEEREILLEEDRECELRKVEEREIGFRKVAEVRECGVRKVKVRFDKEAAARKRESVRICTSVRVRPVLNVPVCSSVKNHGIPRLLPAPQRRPVRNIRNFVVGGAGGF